MPLQNNLRISSLIILTSLVLLVSCNKHDGNYVNVSVAGSKVKTTLDRTLVPVPVTLYPFLSIFDVAKYDQYGYGQFTYGPGVPCQKRLDLMPAGYNGESAKPAATLLHFFTVTDIHLTDKESPCQTIFFAPIIGPGGLGCYSPLILYTTHVFDAAVKTINKLDDELPFDLGLALGDLANNTQKNELDWFIRLMDGGLLTPSSGQQKPGTLPDYQQPYTAEGLHSHIPWYAALGNHDHFWSGSKPVADKIRNAYTGSTILKVGWAMGAASEIEKDTYSMGTIDGSTQYGTVIGCGIVAKTDSIPEISADNNRRTLASVNEWIDEFRTSTSLPYGHGFIQNNPKNMLGACYSFIPKSDIPLKIIVIDDTQPNNDTVICPDSIYGHGELPPDRYHWLMEQLQSGQNSNQLMIIAAHVPIHVLTGVNAFSWIPIANCYSSEDQLVEQLQSFPNLILWVAGHRHLNNVTAIPSKDAAHPENGFWEVETKSTREFPEQFRTFDIVRNSDNSVSVITTNVDIEMKDNSLPAIGRKYAIAANQIYKIMPTLLESGSVSYNAELIKMLTPAMKERASKCGKVIIK